MAIKLFLKIFFALPVWLLRCITFQKSTIINNQILDFQTQIFLGLQSLQVDGLDDPGSFDSVQEIREFMIEGLPLSSKPSMPLRIKDHVLSTQFGHLKIRQYCPEMNTSSSPILYFHGGGYVLGGIESHDAALQFFAAEIETNIFSLDYRLAPENKFPSSLQDANFALEWLGKELNLPISLFDFILSLIISIYLGSKIFKGTLVLGKIIKLLNGKIAIFFGSSSFFIIF